MRIGVPTEIKNNENRVAMTPAGVVQLVKSGHEVFIQKRSGTRLRIYRQSLYTGRCKACGNSRRCMEHGYGDEGKRADTGRVPVF